MTLRFPIGALGASVALLLFGAAAPSPLRAQNEVVSAGAGMSRSLDGRAKTKNFGDVTFAWLLSGSLPAGSENSLVCTGRFFDGTGRDGLPKRRKGVKVRFSGELMDAETGTALQKLKAQKVKTDKQGDFRLEFPVTENGPFWAMVSGESKKKKTTGAFFDCRVEPVAETDGLTAGAWRRETLLPPEVTQETFRKHYQKTLFSSDGTIAAAANLQVSDSLASQALLSSCLARVRLVDQETGAPVKGAMAAFTFNAVAVVNPTNPTTTSVEVEAKATTDENGFAFVEFPRKLKRFLNDHADKFILFDTKVDLSHQHRRIVNASLDVFIAYGRFL